MYPKEVPERKYQIEIIQSALLHNTLVCLPTGLGKTLIAAVVMHNFARWFPKVRRYSPEIKERMKPGSMFERKPLNCCIVHSASLNVAGGRAPLSALQGKIIFVAPTRPLVKQQIDACRKFMGMHEVGAADRHLTGATVLVRSRSVEMLQSLRM